MKNLIKKMFCLALMLMAFVFVFAADGETDAKQSVVKIVWQFLQDNWWWIATALLAISEGLAGSKLKSNAIYQLVINWLKKKSNKPN